MFDLSGQQILFRIASIALIFATHGFAVATLARLMGDPGPGYDGRRTLNPLRHADALGALVMVLFRIGWIKPIAVDPALLRGRGWGLLVVVLGSLAVTLLVAEALWLVRPTLLSSFPGTSAVQTLVLMCENAAMLSVVFAIANLIPLPPFTAGLLLAGVAPRLHAFLSKHVLIVAVALALVVFFADRGGMLDPAVRGIRGFFLN